MIKMKFEKVSFDQWFEACYKNYWDLFSPNKDEFEKWVEESYNHILLPERSTKFSAGYDFFNPFPTLHLNTAANTSYRICTGVRWHGDNDKVLIILPRSGFGTKYGFALDNTAGVIDADYYHAANEGHIMAQVHVRADMKIESGQAFMQGIILPYYTVEEDTVDNERVGGFGSTDKNNNAR